MYLIWCSGKDCTLWVQHWESNKPQGVHDVLTRASLRPILFQLYLLLYINSQLRRLHFMHYFCLHFSLSYPTDRKTLTQEVT